MSDESSGKGRERSWENVIFLFLFLFSLNMIPISRWTKLTATVDYANSQVTKDQLLLVRGVAVAVATDTIFSRIPLGYGLYRTRSYGLQYCVTLKGNPYCFSVWCRRPFRDCFSNLREELLTNDVSTVGVLRSEYNLLAPGDTIKMVTLRIANTTIYDLAQENAYRKNYKYGLVFGLVLLLIIDAILMYYITAGIYKLILLYR